MCQDIWAKLSSGCGGCGMASVRLLVMLDSGYPQSVLEWCIENEFELIEWPQDGSSDAEDGIIGS